MSKPKEHDPRAERRPSRYESDEDVDAWFDECEPLPDTETSSPATSTADPQRQPPPDFAKTWEPLPAGTVIARPRESAEGRGGLNDRSVPGWRRQRQA